METNTDWDYGYPFKPLIPYGIENDAELSVHDQEAHNTKALKSLLNFCVNNKDLDKLESLISAFNPLKILGVADFEIRHSNVLAWFISPDAHHGLGDILFKKILLETLRGSKGDELPRLEDVISADFSDLKVLREWRNIDIFAFSHSNKLAFVIENKVNAEESEQQLSKYVDIVQKKYPDYKKVFVFLSLNGTAPKGSDRYISFTHEQIYGIVQPAVELRRDFMHTKVYDFIRQYLQILEEKTMRNEELVDICSKLYKEHKDAIKMITEYGKPKLPSASIQEFHRRTVTESVHADKNNVNVYYTFIPQAWHDIMPTTNKYTQDKYLVFFCWNFSEYESHKITLSLSVGNFPDPNERSRFIKEISEAVTVDKNGKLNVRMSSKTNTTIFSKSISLKYGSGDDCDLDDYEAVTAKLVEVYNGDEVQKALHVVDGVVKNFGFER